MNASSLMHRLSSMLNAEDHELRPALQGFLLFVCLFAGYFMLRPIRESMGIAAGVENLQWLFTATFFVMLAAVPLFAWLSARVPRLYFIDWVYGCFGANLLVFAVLSQVQADSQWIARVFYVWISVGGRSARHCHGAQGRADALEAGGRGRTPRGGIDAKPAPSLARKPFQRNDSGREVPLPARHRRLRGVAGHRHDLSLFRTGASGGRAFPGSRDADSHLRCHRPGGPGGCLAVPVVYRRTRGQAARGGCAAGAGSPADVRGIRRARARTQLRPARCLDDRAAYR